MMTALWWDLRMAWRAQRRSPAFSLVSIVVLALGLGITTTMFSAMDSVLLRPLPYREQDRLVALRETGPNGGARAGVAAGTFLDWRRSSRSFEALAAYRPWGFVLKDTGGAERVLGARISAGLLPLLGVTPRLGRGFREADEEAGAPRTVLLSEALWRRRYSADSGLIGRTVMLDDEPATVAGVLPEGYALPAADLWVPLRMAPYEIEQRGARAFSVVGRLRSGVALAAAREEMRVISGELATEHPAEAAGWQAVLVPLKDEIVGDSARPLILLLMATLGLLAVACANLGNLLLARGMGRVREMAVRSALGGARIRLTRQLLAENLLLVALSGGLGLAIAVAGTSLLSDLAPRALLPRGAIEVSRVGFGFAASLSLLVGLVLGAIPAAGLARLDLGAALRGTGQVPPGGVRRRITGRDLLLVGQVALAVVLLVETGLLLRSLRRLAAVDPGFEARGVTTATISLGQARYSTPEERLAFYHRLEERVTTIAGVEGMALASHLPLGGGPLIADVIPRGWSSSGPGDIPRAQLTVVSPRYFGIMGVRLLRGRGFTPSDREQAVPVAVVDASLAARLWPGEDPIGQQLRIGASIGADTAAREVIGVVSPVHSLGLEQPAQPMVYLPLDQVPWPTMSLLVRTRGTDGGLGPALLAAVWSIDPLQPAYNLRSMEDLLDRALAARRFQALMLGLFGAAALVLAVVGVYAVFAFEVACRTRELGLRAALGATRERLFGSLLGRAMLRVGAGLVLGGAAALVGGRLTLALLYQVSPADPATFAATAGLLLVTGGVAGYLPARRAMRLEPAAALRRDQ